MVEFTMAESLIVYRPPPGQTIVTPEEYYVWQVCANCNEVREHHLADDHCAFSPTLFKNKKGVLYERTLSIP